MMNKTLISIFAATAIAVAFSGCASTKKSKASKSKTTASTTTESNASATASSSSSSTNASSSANTTKKTHPYVDYDSQEKAEASAGFKLNVPSSLPFTYTKKISRSIPNEMIEIIYTTGDSAAYIDKVATEGSSSTVNNNANKSGSTASSSSASSGNGSSSASTTTVSTGTGDEVRLRKAKGSEDISGDMTKYLITKNMAANLNKAESKRVELRGEVNNYHVATWVDGAYTYAITSKKGLTEQQILAFADQLY
ncbi:MAG: hypothetical protein IJ828_00825 [Treponema sp.]|nr:hypothetical protein [Treponema sp.]